MTAIKPYVPPEFVNASKMEFADISSEQFREYTFPCGTKVLISEPLRLSVSASGGHRLFDSRGASHYVPDGWIHLMWVARPGEPHFVV